MTKKDYIEIAKIIRNAKEDVISEYIFSPISAVRQVAIEFCSILKKDNPRFNKDKFLKVCGF